MSKLSDLMKGYGSGDISLGDAVNALLSHAWITPPRFHPGAESLPTVVEDSWDEIENAFNCGDITFSQYRDISHEFDSLKKSHGILLP